MTRLFDESRRSFLQLGLATLASVTVTPALAAVPRPKGIRALGFRNLHTDEKLRVDYWKDGKYDRAGLAKINRILRDHYSGDVRAMSLRLLDLLHDLQGRMGHEGAIEVISGYRSPRTNLKLASASDGVAKHSYHTKGMAIDIRLPGKPLTKVYQTALNMRRGGAGFYPDSQFVHVDVGPVRRW
ncbi:MAG: DUF882 domain-containing protein [Alphaproteobacteria bacterium]|nr:DUF882 domain-containing protein [Alphaproteobacteria bacterium]